MNDQDVDSIAYLIDRAKKNNKPKPIVFLGAGASVTAGIPGAEKIKDDILTRFKAKPSIKKLNEEDKKDYYKVMGCLNSTERIELLRLYITNEHVKLNVAHIYLAQLLKEGYIDYVLTVNFDDLILKASALFNFIPPVYDIAILNDFTTETLLKKSVTYLHGQHNGFWLLNTKQEFNKINDKGSVKRVFDSICSGRTWIIVGYSGEDVIFDQIANMGCFTNDLFWVTYNDNVPIAKVQEQLLDKENTNAYLVTGYDADSFFLKLHGEISQLDHSLKTPEIFNTPFSFLKRVAENIKDIEEKENDHTGLFRNVKERSEESKKWIVDAINKYEEKSTDESVSPLTESEIYIGQLKNEIIDAILKKQYEKADAFFEKAKEINTEEINILVSILYDSWGNALSDLAKLEGNKTLYLESFEKYKTAVALNPKNDSAFNNWGAALYDLAKQEEDKALYLESIEKYKIATELNPKYDSAFNSWGNALSELAKLEGNKALFLESFEKYKTATSLNPKDNSVFYNWGNALVGLAKISMADEQINLYTEAENVLKKGVSLGGGTYNLACLYALTGKKNEALDHLKNSLSKKEVTAQIVKDDSDWKTFSDDQDFKALLEMFK